MEFKDYYEIIGINPDANQNEIKRAYKKLARKYHPDVSKDSDAEMKFKELGEAYEVLKDPEKRVAYDQFGANYIAGQNFNPPPDWDAGFKFNGGGFSAGDSAVFNNFFESLFSEKLNHRYANHTSRGRTQYYTHGEDHHAEILIDLEDTFKGVSRTVTLQTPDIDNQGHIVTSVTRTRTLNVNIPKGVKQGQLIRLAAQGTPGAGGGKSGDLYLEVNFKPHPIYHVEGKDIYLDLPIAPWEAALGTRIKAPTPEGSVDLMIPAGSTSGRKVRLKGQGIPAKIAGDLYVVLKLVLPPANSQQAEAFYQKMEKEFKFKPRAGLEVSLNEN